MINGKTPRHGFLFGDDNGPWLTDQLTKALTRETTSRIGFRMTIQELRHIAIAIDRKFIRGENVEEDDDEEEDDDVHDLMAAHSTKLATARYARMGGLTRSLTSESIDIFRSISDKWQRWFQLVSRRLNDDELPKQTVPITFMSTALKMDMAIKKLYGTTGRFSNEKQKEMVRTVIDGASPLFIILPTGAGKSLSFMVPALLPEANSTIVITPLVALAEDILRRCKEANIDCIIYGRVQARYAKIIIVITESAISDSFVQFILDIHIKGKLDRIVFDEMHKIITDVSFRPRLEELNKLALPVQFVFLTATFPPLMIKKFEERMLIKNGIYIRQVSHKAQVRYSVQVLSGWDIKKQIYDILHSLIGNCGEMEKVLVFCRSRLNCMEWGRRFKCGVYYSDSENKKDTLQDWKCGVLFATSALGAGVDISGIRWVVHLEKPYGMVEFEQEIGRGGRGGEIVHSLVLVGEREYDEILAQEESTLVADEAAMREFIMTKECRRRIMSGYMNGESEVIDCEELGGELCDICVGGLGETEVGKRRREFEELESRELKRVRVLKEREELLRESEKEKGRLREEDLWWQRKLQGECVVCWLLYDDLELEHCTKECTEWLRVLGERYTGFRGKYLGYRSNTSCYKCGLPGDLCVSYGNKRKCLDEDVILPASVVGYMQQELGLREGIEELAERRFEDIEDYCKWLTGGRRVLDENGSNAFGVFSDIIRRRLNKETILLYLNVYLVVFLLFFSSSFHTHAPSNHLHSLV
jgi:superfamily II DNA helicase RecQ